MNAPEFLKVYLSANLSMIVGYLCFGYLRRAFGYFQMRFDFLSEIRVAQILILVSILFPISLDFLPTSQLAPFNWGSFLPDSDVASLAEDSGKIDTSHSTGVRSDVVPLASNFVTQLKNWFLWIIDYEVATLVLLVLVIGIAIMFGRLLLALPAYCV